jgi:hypothetical protein
MSGNHGLLALVKASKRSTALHRPVNEGVSNADAWPTKEHETLKAALKKDKFYTDLMLIMQMSQVNIKQDLKKIDDLDRPDFTRQYENALSYRLEGTTANKGSLYNFEHRLIKIKALVVQHVRDCMLELHLVTSRQKTLFTSSQGSSGAVSQDALLREDMQLHTLLNDILAKNMLKPGTDEDSQIIDIILKENNLKATDLLETDKVSVAKEAKLYKKSLMNMREMFTHYLLYAFGTFCKSETVDQLKVQQQQHFLSPAYKAAAPNKKPLYTAQVAIDYLTKECYTSNERTITALKRKLERTVRYTGETLFSFLNRFSPLINELESATGKVFDQAELVQLWQFNFVKHMNKNEKQTIKIDHADFLTNTEWSAIKHFGEGKFDFSVMNKLLTRIGSTLGKWKAGPEVREWNDQRKIDFQWDHEIDYNPPIRSGDKRTRDPDDRNHDQDQSGRGRSRDVTRQKRDKKSGRDRRRDKGDKPRDRASTHRDSDKDKRKKGRSLLSKVKSRIPFSLQCKEVGCIKKGVQGTHEWAKCTLKGKPYTPQSSSFDKNKFKGNNKSSFNKNKGLNRDHGNGPSSSSSKFKKKGSGKGPPRDRKCWNCGDPGHLSPDCPRQAKINHLLQESEEFTCLLAEQFDTEELWDCSQRMINTYGKRICWSCCKPSCEGDCTVDSDPTSAFMPTAHEIMNDNPDIGRTIQSAIHKVDDTDPSAHYMAPLNHQMFYQSQEGQDDEGSSPDDQPMELNFNRNLRSKRSRSRSKSRSRSRSSENEDPKEDPGTSDSESEVTGTADYHSQDEDLGL